jgi:hypothetical protein
MGIARTTPEIPMIAACVIGLIQLPEVFVFHAGF